MQRNNYIWVLLGLLVLLTVLGWGYNERAEKLAMRKTLDTQNQKAFTEMVDSVENVEINLGKSIVSGSTANSAVIMGDIWRQANQAQSRLNELPVSSPVLERTSKFLAQTGDYAYSLTRVMAKGQRLSQEETDKLKTLHTQAGDLSQQLHKIFNSAEDGRFTWGELNSSIQRRLPKADDNLSGSMKSIDKKMQEYPTLIYDGPFSDHINKINPRGVTGKRIDRDDALDIARSFVDIPQGKIRKVSHLQTVNGEIPIFRVRVTSKNSKVYGVTDVDVSVTGGHVIMATNNRAVPNRHFSERKALKKAADFLKGKGLGAMENTFYTVQNNILLAAFANVQQSVLIYPDQVKVQVALDTGQVMGYEALNYYMTHYKRTLPAPKITVNQARQKVSKNLKIEGSRLALIPRTVGGEVLTYEFRGKIKGDTYYVYINALTGAEENILKLFGSGEGTLAM
jgi:germination protein YpeB